MQAVHSTQGIEIVYQLSSSQEKLNDDQHYRHKKLILHRIIDNKNNIHYVKEIIISNKIYNGNGIGTYRYILV